MTKQIEKIEANDPLSQSANIVDQNIDQLKQLFPEVFKEGKIDWQELQATLGEHIDEENERFNFTWNGKSMARQEAQKPSTGTLRPCPEESVDWENTKNLYIEGDNLEVLKLLQKSYHQKVKMIYIDPPYNTGKDFVYKDNYKDNLSNYLELTGQKDNEGNKLHTNSDASGRYHSNWLNMMYPRLKLARNLLKDDGVIFISIDEIEFNNLKSLCNEIFGEENHIADFVWKNKKGGGNDSKYVAVEHEYVIMYAKNEIELHNLFEPYKPEYLKRYNEEDSESKFFWDTFKRKSGKQYYPILCPDGTTLEKDEFGNKISWLRSKNRFEEDYTKGDVRILKNKKTNSWSIQFKQRLPKGKKPRTVYLEESIFDTLGTTSQGSSRVFELFNSDVFSNPKPLNLIKHLISFSANKNNDIILDFFAGSGTIHDSMINQSVEDLIQRRVISIQLPEEIRGENEIALNAKKHKFNTIAELSRERIRRAGKKIAEEHPEKVKNLDLGFKAFKLDSSNIKTWSPDTENIEQELWDSVENIKADRTENDLLYEILLKYGLDLTAPITEHSIENTKVYSVGLGALLVCMANQITVDVAQGIAELKEELQPETCRVVFKDNGFANSADKTNVLQKLKQHQIEEVRSI
ncbi:site-specific DNA-methyltransferase [Wenyingzhuangia sp. IMCC45574]